MSLFRGPSHALLFHARRSYRGHRGAGSQGCQVRIIQQKGGLKLSSDILASYGLVPIGSVRITGGQFRIEITNLEMFNLGRCVFAFLVGNEIVRIGSSKAPLRRRFSEWQRHVTNRLQGRKSPTPPAEAAVWDAILRQHGSGIVFARPGTIVTTPIGEFSAYLDEESVLLGRHRPRLNSSKHR
jgi:hypothetical protein